MTKNKKTSKSKKNVKSKTRATQPQLRGRLLSDLTVKADILVISSAETNTNTTDFILRDKEYSSRLRYGASVSSGNKWTISFDDTARNLIKDSIKDHSKVQILVIGCRKNDTDSMFKNTSKLVVINMDDVLKCIGSDNINKTHSLSVEEFGKDLYCYGTALSSENALKIKSFDEFFGFKEINKKTA